MHPRGFHGTLRGVAARMSPVRSSVRHAGSLYSRVFGWLRHPFRGTGAEAHHLYEVEQAGTSAATPLIAFLGLILFIVPIFLVMLGIVLLGARLLG